MSDDRTRLRSKTPRSTRNKQRVARADPLRHAPASTAVATYDIWNHVMSILVSLVQNVGVSIMRYEEMRAQNLNVLDGAIFVDLNDEDDSGDITLAIIMPPEAQQLMQVIFNELLDEETLAFIADLKARVDGTELASPSGRELLFREFEAKTPRRK